MKKYCFIIAITLSSLASFGQEIRALSGFDPITGRPGYIYRDTSIVSPFTTLKYLTGYNTWGSFRDTARGSISLTTTGSGAATYSAVTGILNVPTPGSGGGQADSTLFWQLLGNAPAYGTFLGTTTNRSLRFRTNNTEAMVIDSATRNVGIGGAASTTSKLLVSNGSITALGQDASSVNLWVAGTIRSSVTGMFLDGSPSLTGTISVRADIVSMSAAATVGTTLSAGTSINSSISGGAGGYKLNNNDVLNLKGDSSVIRINDNTSVPKVSIRARNTLLNDDNTSALTWTGGDPAMSAVLEMRSTTRGMILPRMTKTQRDAIVMSGASGGTITNGGTGYSVGQYPAVALTGGSGTGATAKITVVGGVVSRVSIVAPGTGYVVGNVLSSSLIGAGSNFQFTISTLTGSAGMAVYQTDNTPGLRVWNGTNWMKYTEATD